MLSPEFDNIPDELKSRSQWLLWRLETRAGQTTKVPYQPDGCKAAVDKPATWIDYETAKTAYLKGNIKFDGVGFVLTAADPIVGVDLDKCLTPETGNSTRWLLRSSPTCRRTAKCHPLAKGCACSLSVHSPQGDAGRDSWRCMEKAGI